MSKNSNARYKKSRELREKDQNTNTKIYFEIRATALRPHLHTEGFSLSTKDLPQRDIHGEVKTYKTRSTQLQLSYTSTQEG